ncbi:hypothetical protein Tco_0744534 [Tanacetum coccineum]
MLKRKDSRKTRVDPGKFSQSAVVLNELQVQSPSDVVLDKLDALLKLSINRVAIPLRFRNPRPSLLLLPPHLSPSKKVNLFGKNSKLIPGGTTSSTPSLHISETSDYFLEEFIDELAHITFPPGNDDLPFDAKSDLLKLDVENICLTMLPITGNIIVTQFSMVDFFPRLMLCFKRPNKRTRISNPPLSLYEFLFHKEVPGLGCPRFLKPFVLSVFVLRSQELQILSFILGIRYPNLID